MRKKYRIRIADLDSAVSSSKKVKKVNMDVIEFNIIFFKPKGKFYGELR